MHVAAPETQNNTSNPRKSVVSICPLLRFLTSLNIPALIYSQSSIRTLFWDYFILSFTNFDPTQTLKLFPRPGLSREAARECRRKKKEYVKCLENRVAVLENQNKTLIEELKTLKDLYCVKTG